MTIRRRRRSEAGGPGRPRDESAAASAPEDHRDGGPGSLYVVATPIGNLADVTLRALEVLRDVDLVAAEDTRHTRRLFARHGISTAMTSLHARNARARVPELVDRLRAGTDIAVVTDAGTPGVSDPGEELVAAWSATGGRVVPIPGPSALLAAIAATGIAGPRWCFDGFLPRAGAERRRRLERLAADDRGTILFEAPGRLVATLRELAEACGGERPGAVCRELTKLHESVRVGTLAELAAAAVDGRIPALGELTIVVGARRGRGPAGAQGSTVEGEAALARASARVEALVAAGTPRGAAARIVAADTGLPRRRLYGALEPGRDGEPGRDRRAEGGPPGS